MPPRAHSGKELVFVSNRPDGAGGLDLWLATRHEHRDDLAWESPVNLSALNTSAAEFGPGAYEDESGATVIYFNSNRSGGAGEHDLYMSTRPLGGTFSSPTLLAELSTTAQEQFAALSRDGREIFFSSSRAGSLGGLDLWSATREHTSDPWGTPENLGTSINSTADEGRPAIAWDGMTLMFHSNRAGSVDLYQSTRTRLPGGGTGIPGSIAFPTARDGNREVYVMNADGSGQTRLTFHPAEDFIPSWSPDGKQIVFTSNRDGNGEIHIMNADGSDPRNLTNHPAFDNAAVFSPNAKRIAFQSNRGGKWALYVMNPDGGQQTRLTHHTGTDQWPDWSPDGKQIVFQRDGDIYVVELATGHATQLTWNSAHEDMPVFSPDGKQIAFMSQRDGYNAIFVMNADGSEPVNLTPRPAGETIHFWAMFPEWSRNGQQIYFQAIRPETGPQSDLYVMNADGTGVTRLTTDPGFDGAPDAR